MEAWLYQNAPPCIEFTVQRPLGHQPDTSVFGWTVNPDSLLIEHITSDGAIAAINAGAPYVNRIYPGHKFLSVNGCGDKGRIIEQLTVANYLTVRLSKNIHSADLMQ